MTNATRSTLETLYGILKITGASLKMERNWPKTNGIMETMIIRDEWYECAVGLASLGTSKQAILWHLTRARLCQDWSLRFKVCSKALAEVHMITRIPNIPFHNFMRISECLLYVPSLREDQAFVIPWNTMQYQIETKKALNPLLDTRTSRYSRECRSTSAESQWTVLRKLKRIFFEGKAYI